MLAKQAQQLVAGPQHEAGGAAIQRPATPSTAARGVRTPPAPRRGRARPTRRRVAGRPVARATGRTDRARTAARRPGPTRSQAAQALALRPAAGPAADAPAAGPTRLAQLGHAGVVEPAPAGAAGRAPGRTVRVRRRLQPGEAAEVFAQAEQVQHGAGQIDAANLRLGLLRPGRAGSTSLHRRTQTPGCVRPARPARWSAEAREIGASSQPVQADGRVEAAAAGPGRYRPRR